MTDMGGNSGSRASVEPVTRLDPSGFDPGRSVFKNVVCSLRGRPKDWERCYGWLRHKQTGVSVWIFSGRFGLEIANRPFGETLWGGVTLLSSIELSPRHWQLNAAVRHWFERNAIATEARRAETTGSACEGAALKGIAQ